MLQARYPVVLASASPRRRELLSGLFPDFEIVEPDLDEDRFRSDDPWGTARASARAKSDWIASNRPEALVIAGDTVVALEVPSNGPWKQLGKPIDSRAAVSMLESLSGKKHAVISAVALRWPAGSLEFDETSRVTFAPLSREQIEQYVGSGEPMDKAGAYAIQGGAERFVTKVEGKLSTVIGFPIERLEAELILKGLAFTSESANL